MGSRGAFLMVRPCGAGRSSWRKLYIVAAALGIVLVVLLGQTAQTRAWQPSENSLFSNKYHQEHPAEHASSVKNNGVAFGKVHNGDDFGEELRRLQDQSEGEVQDHVSRPDLAIDAAPKSDPSADSMSSTSTSSVSPEGLSVQAENVDATSASRSGNPNTPLSAQSSDGPGDSKSSHDTSVAEYDAAHQDNDNDSYEETSMNSQQNADSSQGSVPGSASTNAVEHITPSDASQDTKSTYRFQPKILDQGVLDQNDPSVQPKTIGRGTGLDTGEGGEASESVTARLRASFFSHYHKSSENDKTLPKTSIESHAPEGFEQDPYFGLQMPENRSFLFLFMSLGVAIAFKRSARLRFLATRVGSWFRRRFSFLAPLAFSRIRSFIPSLSDSKRSSTRQSLFSRPRSKLSDLHEHVSAIASSVTKTGANKPGKDATKHLELKNMVRSFKPRRRDVPSAFRSVISNESMDALVSNLPERLTASDWALLYASELHGYNLTTAYQKAQNFGPFIIVVMDMNRYVFGAFSDEALKCGARQYYGGGESFIFQLEPSFRCHRWSGGNTQFVLSTREMLAFGGGGHFALFLDAMFEQGSSEPGSTTFESYDCLSSHPRFKCCAVEIWSFVSPMMPSPTKRRAMPFPSFR